MEVGKNQNLPIFLVSGTNNNNLAIGRIFFSKSGEFGSIFSWKIFPTGRNHIFPVVKNIIYFSFHLNNKLIFFR
jgi:hypothetical protein